jgi:sortase A
MDAYDEARAVALLDRQAKGNRLRLSIPALKVDAPVVPVALEEKTNQAGRPYRQWTVPDQFAAGWHDTSAPPGQPGNTVLNGHNNVHGAIFHDLVDLPLGEKIILYTNNKQLVYEVAYREFLLEMGKPLRTRLRNARWIAPSHDARLTIVTCWPNTSNSHRLVVVALPISESSGS